MATVNKDFVTRNGVQATNFNNVAITRPASLATFALGSGKTFTVSNTLTFTGTDSSSVAFGGGGTVAYTGGTLGQFASTDSATLRGVISDETGSGALVFGTSPTFTTSVIAGSATMAIFNTTATTVNAFGAATILSLGAGSGTTTVNNNLTVTGNLIVNGTTTTVNSTTVTIDDPIFVLGGDTAPASDDNIDRGIEFRWHNGTTAKLGFFGYDDSTGYFTFIPDATDTSGVISGTQGDIQATNFRGALIGNADTATNAAGLNMTNAAATSKNVTVTANATPTTLDSFLVATYTSAEYLIQMKQGTKMTTTKVVVMWDGTDIHVNEYAVTDATAGAANATITATHAAGTATISASSSDAATTNVVIKAAVTYIKA